MPESLTPITREETYLAAIAGEEVSVPDPICRKEEFLDAIDTHIGSVEGDVSNVSGAVTALQTQIPASTAGDEGKVLTAGSTAGTASWQTLSGGGEVYNISLGLTTALLSCVQTAVGAAVAGGDNLAYGADSGQQPSSESDTETAFAAAKAFFEGGSVKLSFPGIGVKLSPTMAYWSDSDPGYELYASIGGIIPAYKIPWVGTGFVQWNLNIASQLDGDDPIYGYDIYVAVSINKAVSQNNNN